MYPQYSQLKRDKKCNDYTNIQLNSFENYNQEQLSDMKVKYNYQSQSLSPSQSHQCNHNVTNNVIINNLFIFNQPSKEFKINKLKKRFNTNFNSNNKGFK